MSPAEPGRVDRNTVWVPAPWTKYQAAYGQLSWKLEARKYPGCQVPLRGGSSVSGVDQEEGVGCVVPVTLSPGTFLLCYLALRLSLQHLAPPLSASAVFISQLATSQHLPASLHLPHFAPDRFNYSKCLQPATSSPASFQSWCSLPDGGACTYLMLGSLQQCLPHLAAHGDYLGVPHWYSVLGQSVSLLLCRTWTLGFQGSFSGCNGTVDPT